MKLKDDRAIAKDCGVKVAEEPPAACFERCSDGSV
jgi:hypothetical protein